MERNVNLQMQESLATNRIYGKNGSDREINIKFNKVSDKTTPKDQGQTIELEDCEGFAINCFLCQEIFTDIDELQEHLSIHSVDYSGRDTTTQPINCNVCERSLRSEQELKEHYKRYHEAHLIRKDNEASKQFKCKQCDNIYLNMNFLLDHIALSHTPKEDKAKEITEIPAKMYVAYQYIEPKKKYPPRSPYFNPNLWVDPHGYI